MRVYVSSLGCKLNQSEMDTLAEGLAAAGHQVVASAAAAELCVLNTCAVTEIAARKSRQALRRLHRENPAARLVVTGCYAELSPEDLRGLPGVAQIAGNQAKERLGDLLAAEAPDLGDRHGEAAPHPRTRSLVKIQDGCDNACTYCIIHVARGPQRSRPADEILAQVCARLAAGYQEIILTGVHVGAYGRDRQGAGQSLDLWGLVNRILAETGVPRLRLSSIEPWDLSDEALALWHDRRLCRHLHLPLQSGSEATLRRMGRRYDPASFAALLATARAAIPGLAITTDLIAGFPGETDAEFAESLAFVERMGFARVHVFPYSARPGTPAATMGGQVPAEIRAERASALRAAGAAGALVFRRKFVGQTATVLWESSRPDAQGPQWSGLTDNYLRVEAPHPGDLHNTFSSVRLLAVAGAGLQGEVI